MTQPAFLLFAASVLFGGFMLAFNSLIRSNAFVKMWTWYLLLADVFWLIYLIVYSAIKLFTGVWC